MVTDSAHSGGRSGREQARSTRRSRPIHSLPTSPGETRRANKLAALRVIKRVKVGETWKSATFYQRGMDHQLDSDRFIVNNTHELIVLPVFGQVLQAIRFGLRQPTKSAVVR
jgi:hypothetical protein